MGTAGIQATLRRRFRPNETDWAAAALSVCILHRLTGKRKRALVFGGVFFFFVTRHIAQRKAKQFWLCAVVRWSRQPRRAAREAKPGPCCRWRTRTSDLSRFCKVFHAFQAPPRLALTTAKSMGGKSPKPPPRLPPSRPPPPSTQHASTSTSSIETSEKMKTGKKEIPEKKKAFRACHGAMSDARGPRRGSGRDGTGQERRRPGPKPWMAPGAVACEPRTACGGPGVSGVSFLFLILSLMRISSPQPGCIQGLRQLPAERPPRSAQVHIRTCNRPYRQSKHAYEVRSNKNSDCP